MIHCFLNSRAFVAEAVTHRLLALAFLWFAVGAVFGFGRFTCCSVFMTPTADVLENTQETKSDNEKLRMSAEQVQDWTALISTNPKVQTNHLCAEGQSNLRSFIIVGLTLHCLCSHCVRQCCPLMKLASDYFTLFTLTIWMAASKYISLLFWVWISKRSLWQSARDTNFLQRWAAMLQRSQSPQARCHFSVDNLSPAEVGTWPTWKEGQS